ncbi:hypothetical protein [Streptacidiphilus rugosus]|uniref:hypothetical protein n=1 Tax=Streptacidiphilus rugosus TaxID=405783 RepID=UPI00055E6B2A|nr:hypothetical protein [Streptacidiphilus rugosus]
MTPVGTAVVLALLITLGYSLLCAVSPWARCRKCQGLGFATRQTRRGTWKRGRDCRRCKATGMRIRYGRHLFNRYADVRRRGTR